MHPAGLGQQPGQRGEQRTIGPAALWTLDLPAQDRNLVPQQEDLGSGRIVAGQQRQPRQQMPEDQVDQRQRHAHSLTIRPSRLSSRIPAAHSPRR